MSLDRCLEILEQRYDRDRNFLALFEELSELENVTLDEGEPEDYHAPLAAFLERFEDLYSEEAFAEDIAAHTVSNLRGDLERLRDRRAPTDPLEHLFKDMFRFENGLISAGQALTTLSRYEELILALRFQFEGSTDPSDERETPQMMRNGLRQLENAGIDLRQQLNNGSDAKFDEIRHRFQSGTDILREFRRKANFEKPPEHDEEEWE